MLCCSTIRTVNGAPPKSAPAPAAVACSSLTADRSEAASLTAVAKHAGIFLALPPMAITGIFPALPLTMLATHVMLTFLQTTWVDDHSWMNIHAGEEI